ncbi:hypothetical protein LDENG_00193780 [Lucifuga dentata]|nr:hypothetical protein LDENG_00193780 [Lucifuga dentata]
MLSLFGSTYICEQTFSGMILDKKCLRSRLTDSQLREILCVVSTALKPDLAYVLESRAHQPSH